MDARAMVEEKPYFASSIDAFVVLVGSIHSCHRSFARRVVGSAARRGARVATHSRARSVDVHGPALR